MSYLGKPLATIGTNPVLTVPPPTMEKIESPDGHSRKTSLQKLTFAGGARQELTFAGGATGFREHQDEDGTGTGQATRQIGERGEKTT